MASLNRSLLCSAKRRARRVTWNEGEVPDEVVDADSVKARFDKKKRALKVTMLARPAPAPALSTAVQSYLVVVGTRVQPYSKTTRCHTS